MTWINAAAVPPAVKVARAVDAQSGTPVVAGPEYSLTVVLAILAEVTTPLMIVTGFANTMAEAAGLYTDNGTGFSLVATSAWLKPSALQGFGRLWRFLLQGFFPSSVSSIQVQIAYNYNPAIVDTFVYTPTQASNADQTQLRVDNSIQKCESLQFTIRFSTRRLRRRRLR